MFRTGRRHGGGSLDVFLRPAGRTEGPRIGVVVPRHGRTIVERNRLRRRIRELLRTTWLPLQRQSETPRDLLVRARRQAYERTFDELRDELCDCLDLDGR